MFYIDGGNLYNRLKEHNRHAYPEPTDLYRFAEELCSTTPDDTGVPLGGNLVDVLYCNAPVRVEPGAKNPLQGFMNKIQASSPRFRLRLGTRKNSPACCHACEAELLECPYCQVPMRSRSLEKGVDLQIAVECIADAAHNKFDLAVLFTHDEDYAHLARVLWQRFGKRLKVSYLVTRRSRRPVNLINATPSKQGMAIDRAPCFNEVFPPKPMRSPFSSAALVTPPLDPSTK